MKPPESQHNQSWLRAAEERLTSSCAAFEAGADDGDILFTEDQKITFMAFLEKLIVLMVPR